MKRSLIATVLLFCLGSTGWSCGNGKLLHEEKFAELPSYLKIPEAKLINGGIQIVRPNLGNSWIWNATEKRFRNYEVCVTVSAGPDKSNPVAGVVFFVQNNELLFRVLVSNIHGSYTIDQRQFKNYMTHVPWVSHNVINKGPAAENEISVSTRDNFAQVRINGKVVAEMSLTVVSEDGNTQAGFIQGGGEGNDPQTFTIKNYQIREAVWN